MDAVPDMPSGPHAQRSRRRPMLRRHRRRSHSPYHRQYVRRPAGQYEIKYGRRAAAASFCNPQRAVLISVIAFAALTVIAVTSGVLAVYVLSEPEEESTAVRIQAVVPAITLPYTTVQEAEKDLLDTTSEARRQLQYDACHPVTEALEAVGSKVKGCKLENVTVSAPTATRKRRDVIVTISYVIIIYFVQTGEIVTATDVKTLIIDTASDEITFLSVARTTVIIVDVAETSSFATGLPDPPVSTLEPVSQQTLAPGSGEAG